ncbi:hypothetical protein H072_3970 [Dactylellina haptotyla CBS 200.50]|uniref:MARVEL domain-containing protein n=1 Tax=Dactylellina haptotyla (strain CBS 200.50) TaxID=1284197 RepID=S8AM37_DACHA|nr:hypothetical protein H072_3970 [Dactylellina haptotyla CBS 200.50]
MVLTSALFTGVRVLQIIIAIPIIGMLGWFVDPYVKINQTPPDALLTLFIVSILACAWAMVTFFQWHRYRSMSGPFIAVVDIMFVGAWIAGIYLNRGISNADCSNLSVPVGIQIGDNNYSGGNSWSANVNKPCAMFKASWILSIIDCVLFFITCVLSYTLYRSHRYETRHGHKEYTGGRRSGSTSTYSSHRRHHRHARV